MSNSSSLTPSSGVEYRDGHVLGDRVFFDDGGVASEEPDAGEVLCPLVVALKVLAVGADIVMEDGALCVRVVVFRQDDLLLGIGAADGRTVAVAAFDDLPGADALDPGDLMGMLLVGGTQDLAPVGAGGAQEPLVVHTGDHVLRTLRSGIPSCTFGIKGLEAGGEDDGAHVDLLLLRLSGSRSMALFLQTASQMRHFFSFR